MIEYPIENRSDKTLWVDVDYKRQRTYIYTDMDPDDTDKEISLEPGETIFIHFYVEQSDFHTVDKEGKEYRY